MVLPFRFAVTVSLPAYTVKVALYSPSLFGTNLIFASPLPFVTDSETTLNEPAFSPLIAAVAHVVPCTLNVAVTKEVFPTCVASNAGTLRFEIVTFLSTTGV